MTRIEAFALRESAPIINDKDLNQKEKTLVMGIIYNSSVETLRGFNQKQQDMIMDHQALKRYGMVYGLYLLLANKRAQNTLNKIRYFEKN